MFFNAQSQEHKVAAAASSEALDLCQLRIQNEADVAKDLLNHEIEQYRQASDAVVQHQKNMHDIGVCATTGCMRPHAAGYIHCCRTCTSTEGHDHGPACRAKHRTTATGMSGHCAGATRLGVCATSGCTQSRREGWMHCCRSCAIGARAPQLSLGDMRERVMGIPISARARCGMLGLHDAARDTQQR